MAIAQRKRIVGDGLHERPNTTGKALSWKQGTSLPGFGAIRGPAATLQVLQRRLERVGVAVGDFDFQAVEEILGRPVNPVGKQYPEGQGLFWRGKQGGVFRNDGSRPRR